ncbi:MAG: hypothetical protein U5R14_05600 [Gemmatimonadota bacterium]|nr:hypothetical protein [Gemmatimonadota bacterium]
MVRSLLVALFALVLATPASAQIAWDSPSFISPVAPAGLSLFFLRADAERLGALGTYRHDAGALGLGYRFAVTEERGPEDVAVAGGVDVSGFLARGIEDADVDVVWWSGLGAGIGNETVVSVPLGLIVGWSGESDTGVIFSPYGGGHVALDFVSGPGDNVDFQGAVDLGTDIVLNSGWMIRFGATLGDREALALGFKIPN